jgi:hypothetical protein
MRARSRNGIAIALILVGCSDELAAGPSLDDLDRHDPPEGKSVPAWPREALLLPSEVDPGSSFGAAIAIDGESAIVGAPRYDRFGGAAWVFVRGRKGWVEQGKLDCEDPQAYYACGTSVTIDGDTAVVGASSGAAIFARRGGEWRPVTTLRERDAPRLNRFGYTVALARDTLVVGAPCAPWVLHCGPGAAYVYQRTQEGWIPRAELRPLAGVAHFGRSVAANGDTVVVGAGRDGTYVYVHRKTKWVLDTILPAGEKVAAYGGTIAALDPGLPGEDCPPSVGVFVEARLGWTEHDRIVAGDADGDTRLALWGDTLIVGDRVWQRVEGDWWWVGRIAAGDTVAVWGDTVLSGGDGEVSVLVHPSLNDDWIMEIPEPGPD